MGEDGISSCPNIFYTHIHQANETVITKDKISAFAEKLSDRFIRIHRSFIVNRQMCTACTAHDVEIGEKEIPIGGSYKEEVMRRLRSDALSSYLKEHVVYSLSPTLGFQDGISYLRRVQYVYFMYLKIEFYYSGPKIIRTKKVFSRCALMALDRYNAEVLGVEVCL